MAGAQAPRRLRLIGSAVANLADELKRVPLFSSLSQRQLNRLGRNFKKRTFRPGAEIVRQKTNMPPAGIEPAHAV